MTNEPDITITQADIHLIIAQAWPEAERRLTEAAFPYEYNPSQEQLRSAHAAVASTEIWRLIRKIVGADDSIRYGTP